MPFFASINWCTGAVRWIGIGERLNTPVVGADDHDLLPLSHRRSRQMPGELALNVALSFIHEPQPVWISTTSPDLISIFSRCSAPVRSAT